MTSAEIVALVILKHPFGNAMCGLASVTGVAPSASDVALMYAQSAIDGIGNEDASLDDLTTFGITILCEDVNLKDYVSTFSR